MLIIASPKSASSSLAETLSKSTGLPVCNSIIRREVLRYAPVACDFRVLGRIHHEDVPELSASQTEEIIAHPGIKKHHLPPTPNNLAQLSATRKVILLRPAEEIIDAYWRGFQTGVWPIEHEAFRKAADIESWRSIARYIGLTRELQQFNQGWLDHRGERLLISYQELLADSLTVTRSILEYFGYYPPSVPELAKLKYTRECDPRLLARVSRLMRKSRAQVRMHYRFMFTQIIPTEA